MDYINQQRILHQPFDISVHKSTFYHYLEVIILPDGTVEYAVPSHQEKLTYLACNKLHISRDELTSLCPAEYYVDYMLWLCSISGAIAVWDKHVVGSPNQVQLDTLAVLKAHMLYLGQI